ncbi:MAG: adenylate/guanylate cyclase domain-containing protein [Candidatus Gracilibacteria bacterium]|jgi:adenylate cyclase
MKFSKFLQNKILAAVLISIIITAISATLIIPDIFHLWHLKIADTLYTESNPSKDIIIVGIDAESTSTSPPGIGRFSQWGRENYTKLLQVLEPESPKVVTFDILFNTYSKGISGEQLKDLKQSADRKSSTEKLSFYEKMISDYFMVVSHPSDTGFAKELAKNNNIVLLGTISEEYGEVVFPIKRFLSQNITVGITYDPLDKDGIIRKVQTTFANPEDQKPYDDLALATVKKYLQSFGAGYQIPNLPLENGKLNVNFFGDPFSFQEISFIDVLNKNFTPGTFKDKIVLVGVTTLKEGQDQVLTPRSNKVPMTGIEFRANEMQTILDQKFLTNQTKFGTLMTITIGAFLLTLLFNYAGVSLSVVVLLLALAGYYFAARLLYKTGFIPNMAYPFVAIIFSYISAWIYRYFIADKSKREITSAFSHYVSETLVNEISKNPDLVKLGGEKKTKTIFFSDLKNSTTLSEQSEITAWVAQINEYFTVMESVIKHFEGTIDKYEGDAIMGFWNAPLSQEDHVIKAYMAALEMKKYIQILNKKWVRNGRSPFEIRIGINTGDAIVGNMGSKNRFDYTAMGDTVNAASRMESCASKLYGGVTVVAGFQNFVREEELNAKVVLREIDTVIFPGKKEPTTVYELVCVKEDLTEEIAGNLRSYAQGLAAYRSRNFKEAERYFAQCKNDVVACVLLERVKILNSGKEIKELNENMVYRILNK